MPEKEGYRPFSDNLFTSKIINLATKKSKRISENF
jgi:hypothetical protein